MTAIITSLHSVVSEVLGMPSIDPDAPLAALGLDSVDAQEVLDTLAQRHGLRLPLARLLSGSIRTLARECAPLDVVDAGPRASLVTPSEHVPLAGPQSVWAGLESKSWGAWANISLCVTLPAARTPPGFLAAMAQGLCDANDALRTSFIRGATPPTHQQVHPMYALPIRLEPAPARDADALRAAHDFEGETISPYGPTARALILAASESASGDARHWLVLTMHHAFCDRAGMRILHAQLRAMIASTELRVASPPSVGFGECAGWLARRDGADKSQRALERLMHGVALPTTELPLTLDIGALPTTAKLTHAESVALAALAPRLGTTLPMLLHATVAALTAQLVAGDDKSRPGACQTMLCHVVHNREIHTSFRDVVGCFDTSVPVPVALERTEPLRDFCARTNARFAEAAELAAALPRGSFLAGTAPPAVDLFEHVPHINIQRGDDASVASEEPIAHALQRVQRTRWGLLVRIALPAGRSHVTPHQQEIPANDHGGEVGSSAAPIAINVFAEHRPLAVALCFCLTRLLRALLAQRQPEEASLLSLVDGAIELARTAAAQVKAAAATVSASSAEGAFIWQRLVERQKRWYNHDAQMALRRDTLNRFVSTAANPFPFTQLDKLAERGFLDTFNVPQPALLHVLPIDTLADELPRLAPTLPTAFVIKPVGAGHSFGVTVVRNGVNVTRGGVPFDALSVAHEMRRMAAAGGCTHEGKYFAFNFSKVLIEACVDDELGLPTPSDYKVFVLGGTLLWVQLHFRTPDGLAWVAFVDGDFELLPQPAWDPTTCWRTHQALVATERAMIAPRKPRCWEALIRHALRLGERLRLFVRLDWYADLHHGPLMGEITLFPHMLQPRSFYSTWANVHLRALWRGDDGCVSEAAEAAEVAAKAETSRAPAVGTLIEFHDTRTRSGAGDAHDGLLGHVMTTLEAPHAVSVLSFLQPTDRPWALGPPGAPQAAHFSSAFSGAPAISFRQLRSFVEAFDLSPWGVVSGGRVGILIANGIEVPSALLGTISRYCAAPLDPATPSAALGSELRSRGARALLIVGGTPEAARAYAAELHPHAVTVIELMPSADALGLPSLPAPPPGVQRTPCAVRHGADALVLLLRTSGTTGAPKTVGFTLSRLMLAGAGIASSLRLTRDDVGLAMLPLHHVGGISCNLIAPLCAESPMRFSRSFDAAAFFGALADGASWVYLVPTLWSLVLQYALEHPPLARDRPWVKLRLVRNAGSALPHGMAFELAKLLGERVTVLPTYGMTEAMPIAAPPVGYRLERPGSVGQPLPGVRLEIIALGGESALAVGDVGEICVAGPAVLPYYEREIDEGDVTTGPIPSRPSERSPESFLSRDQLFRTGDLGRVDADGWLFITGRSKEAINRGGETIAPGEVEEVLRSCPGALGAEIMVFAAAHKQYGDTVGVAVTSRMGMRVGLTQLRAFASTHLPLAMLPQLLVIVGEALPRGASGKLLRARFADQMRATLPTVELGALKVWRLETLASPPCLIEEWSSSGHSVSAPSQAASRGEPDGVIGLTDELVLSEVLAAAAEFVDSPSNETNLSEAGVNSLAGIELAERLSARLGVTLPSSLLSDHPTPASIAARVSLLRGAKPTASGGDVSAVTIDVDGGGANEPLIAAEELRILILHGEAADAALMHLSMRATGWTDEDVSRHVHFIFVDAPQPCAPQPRFHRGAVAAGVYTNQSYRSWGATELNTLAASMRVVNEAIEAHAPIHGVGGICDGGLIAALVAAQRPSLLYLNFCSSPFSRLPTGYAVPATMACAASVHLLSPSDELWSYADLLSIAAACERATVLQHTRGHAVPPLKGPLKRDVLAALGRRTANDAGQDTDDGAEGEALDSLRAMAQYSRSAGGSTHDPVMGHLMFLIVFNVMACHYGDWIGPMRFHAKLTLPVKTCSWSIPFPLEQGMPYWPLLQPLGREDSFAGIAMSMAFLVAGRGDALPKASMQTFFRARVAASVVITVALLYVVQVLHYQWYPPRPLGRGPIYFQEAHRFWPAFVTRAATMGKNEQLLNMFSRTWQLAWFLVLLLVFRLARLLAMGCGVPPKWLAIAALTAACLPRRAPYLNFSDVGLIGASKMCMGVLCVPQVRQASRYLIAYTIAPWLVGGNDWRPAIFTWGGPARPWVALAVKLALIAWCAIAWGMLISGQGISSHRRHDLLDGGNQACVDSPSKTCCSSLLADFGGVGDPYAIWRLLKYDEDAVVAALSIFITIVTVAPATFSTMRPLLRSLPSWRHLTARAKLAAALGVLAGRDAETLVMQHRAHAAACYTAVHMAPPTTLLAVLACLSPWFVKSFSVDNVLYVWRGASPPPGHLINGWWLTLADGQEMVGRLQAITVRCCVMVGWVVLVPRGATLLSRSGANSLLPYLLQHTMQNQFIVPPLRAAVAWGAQIWPLVLPTILIAAEVMGVQLALGLGIPLTFRLLFFVVRLLVRAAAALIAPVAAVVRRVIQRVKIEPQIGTSLKADDKSCAGSILESAREHTCKMARSAGRTLFSLLKMVSWASFVLGSGVFFLRWQASSPSLAVVAGLVRGQPNLAVGNETLADKIRHSCPAIIGQGVIVYAPPPPPAHSLWARWAGANDTADSELSAEDIAGANSDANENGLITSKPTRGKAKASTKLSSKTKATPKVVASPSATSKTVTPQAAIRQPLAPQTLQRSSAALKVHAQTNASSSATHHAKMHAKVAANTLEKVPAALPAKAHIRAPATTQTKAHAKVPAKVLASRPELCFRRCPPYAISLLPKVVLPCGGCKDAYKANITNAVCPFNVTYGELPDSPSERHLESSFQIMRTCGARSFSFTERNGVRLQTIKDRTLWQTEIKAVAAKANATANKRLFLSVASNKVPQLIFVGDSMVARMGHVLKLENGKEKPGRPLVSDVFAAQWPSPLLLGVQTDQTQQLLWRLANGEMPSAAANDPSAIMVLIIGTNNLFFGQTNDETHRGVMACVRDLLTRATGRLLVVGILPRFDNPWKTYGAVLRPRPLDGGAREADLQPWFDDSSPLLEPFSRDEHPYLDLIADVNAKLRTSVHELAAEQRNRRLAFVDCNHAFPRNWTKAAPMFLADRLHLHQERGYRKLATCLERPLHHLEGRSEGVVLEGQSGT